LFFLCFRFLGLNTVTAYQRAKVYGLKIVNRSLNRGGGVPEATIATADLTTVSGGMGTSATTTAAAGDAAEHPPSPIHGGRISGSGYKAMMGGRGSSSNSKQQLQQHNRQAAIPIPYLPSQALRAASQL
jgi:hypothetical protein